MYITIIFRIRTSRISYFSTINVGILFFNEILNKIIVIYFLIFIFFRKHFSSGGNNSVNDY